MIWVRSEMGGGGDGGVGWGGGWGGAKKGSGEMGWG